MKRLFSSIAFAAIVATGTVACDPAPQPDPNSFAVRTEVANGFGAHVSSVTGYQCDAAPVMTRFVGNGWTVDARCIVPGRSAKQQYLGFGDFNGFSITRWPTNAGR